MIHFKSGIAGSDRERGRGSRKSVKAQLEAKSTDWI